MRRNVEVLSHQAPFDEVLKTIGHSRYGGIPVVDDRDAPIEVVNYADVADNLFDPDLRHLVVAAEIAGGAYPCPTPEGTLKTAMLTLKPHPEANFLLVVEQDDPSKLVGIASHDDLLSAQLHQSRRTRQ
jgi:CBS domain-containing protein